MYDRLKNLSAHGRKYFQFGASVCPPSCCRQASWPSSRPTFTARHLLGRVVVRPAEVLGAEQSEDRLRGDGSHEAALMVEPLRVALLGHAVAHERQARCAEREQLVRVDGKVAGVLAAERRLRRAVLEEVAGHPVVLAGTGEALDGLAPVAAVQLCAAFAGRADEHDGEALVERHRDERRLAVARHAFDADLLRVHGLLSLEVIERASTRPNPKRASAPQSSGFRGWPLLTRPMMPFVRPAPLSA